MRRPFAVIGFTYITALLVATVAGLGISAAAAVLCIIFAAVVYFGMSFLKKRKAVTVVFCTAAAAFGIFCVFEVVNYNPTLALAGKNAQIEGTICEDPEISYGRYIYIIDADKIAVDGKMTQVKTKIRVATYTKVNAEPFDRISAKLTLEAPKEINAYGYNSRAYYKSKGIYLMSNIEASDVAVSKPASKPPYYYAIKLRHYISAAIDNYVWDDEGALASGILIGDTQSLPEEVKNNFTDTGISHILAVSGTQTSLIMQYLLLLLCALKLPKRISAVITSAAIVIFMAVTGFSPSVMRAGIMSLVCLAAIIIKRDADVINSLGFSALLLCAVNPYSATDVGLLLSLTATLGMVVISPKLIAFSNKKCEKMPLKLKKTIKPIISLLCETTGASLLTFPVIIISFGRVSLISLISNIVEVPVALVVTLATALLAIMSPAYFLGFLLKPLALIIRLLCAFMMKFAEFLAKLPFASVSANYGYLEIITAFCVVLFIIYFAYKKRGANAPVCLCCGCLAFAVGMFSFTVASHGVMTVSTLSQDGAAVIISNNHAVLIDIPDDKTYPSLVENYLKIRNIRSVDAVVLTKNTEKKIQNLTNLEKEIPVGIVYAPKSSSTQTSSDVKTPYIISMASQIRAPYGVKVTILPDETDTELIALVQCNNARAVVTGEKMSGDYSKYNPKALKSDLLVFSGEPSDDFLNNISPSYVVASGESSCESLAKLMNLGASVSTENRSYMARSQQNFMISDNIS